MQRRKQVLQSRHVSIAVTLHVIAGRRQAVDNDVEVGGQGIPQLVRLAQIGADAVNAGWHPVGISAQAEHVGGRQQGAGDGATQGTATGDKNAGAVFWRLGVCSDCHRQFQSLCFSS